MGGKTLNPFLFQKFKLATKTVYPNGYPVVGTLLQTDDDKKLYTNSLEALAFGLHGHGIQFNMFTHHYFMVLDMTQCCQKMQNTQTLELHEPCGFCLVGVDHRNTEPLFVQLERSQDCIEKLVKALETLAQELHQRKQTQRYFTGEAPIDPHETIDCWICETPFGEEAKALDH